MIPQAERPRIKPIYPVYRLNSKVFRIGAQLGITVEFDDPEGEMWNLVSLLDGRPLAAVLDAMTTKFPHLTPQDVIEGVELLDREGVLEETLPLPSSSANNRYLPNINYFSRFIGLNGSRFDTQQRINDASILLLGAGGGGSNILSLLGGMGPKQLKIVDYDRVEEGNLGRQLLYREPDVGRKKVEVAAEALGAMNSAINVEAIDAKIIDSDDVIPLLEGVDIAICAIDEPPFLIQRVVNKAIVEKNVPCVFGASQVSRGRIFTVIPRRTGCFDCLNIHYAKNDPQYLEQFRAFAQISFAPPSMAYGPSIYSLSALIVDEAVRVLTGYAPARSLGTQYEVNFEDGTSFCHPSWPRYDVECPTCGNGDERENPLFQHFSIIASQ